MVKLVNCRDLGFECEGVVRARTAEEALQKVADHARTVHGVATLPEPVKAKVHLVMRDADEE